MKENRPDPSLSDLDYLNSIRVTSDDVIAFNDDANFVGDPLRSHVDLPMRRYHDDDALATALMVRLGAFHELFHQGALRPWAEAADENGVTTLHPAVFAAIAIEPLIERNGSFLFDRNAFLAKILSLANPDGHA